MDATETSRALGLEAQIRYRNKQLRRHFNDLVDKAANGDALSRESLVDEWKVLRIANDDLLRALTKDPIEKRRNLAQWLQAKISDATDPGALDESDLLQAALAREPSPGKSAPKSQKSVAANTRRRKYVEQPCRSYVTFDDAVSVHYRLVNDFMFTDDPIQPAGVRSLDLLNSALQRQHTSLGDVKKYESLPEVAATLLYGMVLDHPFHNGNKRTGVVVMLQLLDRNHYYLRATDRELFEFLLSVADHRLARAGASSDEEVEAIADWIAERIEHLDKHEYPLTVRDLTQKLQRFGVTVGRIGGKTISFSRKGFKGRRIDFKELGQEVDPGMIHDLRRNLGLAEVNGVTSSMFYGDEESIDVWINKYRTLLRNLARV